MLTFRKERMAEALRKVISEKILKDEPLIYGNIFTINHVSISEDFSLAKVYFSVFGNSNEEEPLAVIRSRAHEFRHEVSKKLNLRKTPKILFCFDKNIEYAHKIDTLFKNNIA